MAGSPRVQINYEPMDRVAESRGEDGTVDFGASDMP